MVPDGPPVKWHGDVLQQVCVSPTVFDRGVFDCGWSCAREAV